MPEEFDGTDSLPTRLTLLGRLADLTDDASWREFFLAYEERIRRVARRHGLPEEDAQEVAQDVFRRVSQTIRDYRHAGRRGSFRSWLFQLTRWRAADRLRRLANERPFAAAGKIEVRAADGEPGDSTLERVPTPPEVHRRFELEAQRHLLDSLLARLESAVSKRNLQMFQMVVLDDVPVPRVAELFHTNPTAVYVIKHRVMKRLRAQVAELKPVLD